MKLEIWDKHFISRFGGIHDLPFYYPEEVEVQKSFLDAWLKGDDREGWTKKGAVPAIDLVLRRGNVGYNNPQGEKTLLRRKENEWPLARTKFTPFHLTVKNTLQCDQLEQYQLPTKLTYQALGEGRPEDILTFKSAPFDSETKITGHFVAHLNVSISRDQWEGSPSDLDLFLTLRHLSACGEEIFYTGSAGEPVPVTKGWLRVSLRKTNPQHPRHRPWLPHRDFYSTDVLPVVPNDVYPVEVELWPTNVVVESGDRLVLEVSSGDTSGTGFWGHNDPIDRYVFRLAAEVLPNSRYLSFLTYRSDDIFRGQNHIHFGPNYVNYITLPVIPAR
jgi:predicted acyl esterase